MQCWLNPTFCDSNFCRHFWLEENLGQLYTNIQSQLARVVIGWIHSPIKTLVNTFFKYLQIYLNLFILYTYKFAHFSGTQMFKYLETIRLWSSNLYYRKPREISPGLFCFVYLARYRSIFKIQIEFWLFSHQQGNDWYIYSIRNSNNANGLAEHERTWKKNANT